MIDQAQLHADDYVDKNYPDEKEVSKLKEASMQNEPQLSAEMEAKLKTWSEQDNGGDFVTEGYGYYEELKHFLATVLEEQRIFYENKTKELESKL